MGQACKSNRNRGAQAQGPPFRQGRGQQKRVVRRAHPIFKVLQGCPIVVGHTHDVPAQCCHQLPPARQTALDHSSRMTLNRASTTVPIRTGLTASSSGLWDTPVLQLPSMTASSNQVRDTLCKHGLVAGAEVGAASGINQGAEVWSG